MLCLDLAEAAGAGAGAVAAGGVAGVVWPNAKAGMAIPIRITTVRDASFTWHLPYVVMDYSTLTLAAFTTFDHFAISAFWKHIEFLNQRSACENRHSLGSLFVHEERHSVAEAARRAGILRR